MAGSGPPRARHQAWICVLSLVLLVEPSLLQCQPATASGLGDIPRDAQGRRLPGHKLAERQGLPPFPNVAEVNGEPSFALVRRNREALQKGRLASGEQQRKAEVLRLFGQLDLAASDERRQSASDLFRRILEVDPTLATAGLTPTLLWNTLLKAYEPARMDRASLNEEVLAEIMQVYVQAGQISSIDWWPRF